jgi:hypothetical protein
MPVKRRVPKTKLRPEITAEMEAWARDQDGSGLFPFVSNDEVLRATWAVLCDDVVAEYVAEYPGFRPIRWWQYNSSPEEPRRRLGGVGTTWADYHSRPPRLYRGLPTEWFDADTIAGYARDRPLRSAAVAVDPSDPPLFESEAAYLRRLGLFLPGEERRLDASDFEPTPIVIPPRPPPPTNGTLQDPEMARLVAEMARRRG